MFTTNTKIAVNVFFILNLMGCGGSEGGGNTSQNIDNVDSDTTSTVDTVDIVDDEVSIKMSELVASDSFDFVSKQQIQVALDLVELLNSTGQSEQRAYVSVYRDYKLLASDDFYPDSSSRVLAGELKGGLFNQSFIGFNNQSTYLIEVWFYNGDQPLQKEKTIVKNNLTW